MIRYFLNLLYCRKYDSSTWYWCIIGHQQVTSLLHINVRRYSRGCKRILELQFLHLADAPILFIRRVYLRYACR